MRAKGFDRLRRMAATLGQATGIRWPRHPFPLSIQAAGDLALTAVDAYWSEHTVNSKPFESARHSEAYLLWRFAEYPLFREYMALWGTHDSETILDYGCGPGDDLIGFLLHTRASKVIGIDLSDKALALARRRALLHRIDPARVELIRTSDGSAVIPIESVSVDYINCGGVLHHTSRPEAILREFHRVLKSGCRARIMVYNRDSLWFHLYTAYVRRIVEHAFPGRSVEEAFSRNTDGEECPVARCYTPGQFLELLEAAGFHGEFVGAYLSRHEVNCFEKFGSRALAEPGLESEHKEFLRNLRLDGQGFPMHRGTHAGIGGVYTALKL